MAGWIPVPMRDWPEHRLTNTCEWSKTLAVMDLRFWADPIACGGKKRPSARKLGEVWGWSPTRVLRFIRAGEWEDERRSSAAVAPRSRRDGAEAAPQERRGSAAPDADGSPTIDESRRDSAEVAPQSRRDDAAVPPQSRRGSAEPPIETRAQSPTPPQAPPPSPTPDKAEVSAPPTADTGPLFGSADKPAPAKPGPVAAAKRRERRKVYPGEPSDDFTWLAQMWADKAHECRRNRQVQAPKWSEGGPVSEAAGLRRLLDETGDPQVVAQLISWHWLGADEGGNRRGGRGLMCIARHWQRYKVMAWDFANGKTREPKSGGGGNGLSGLAEYMRNLDEEEHQQGGPHGQ